MDRLEGVYRADAAIVGGGLTGLLLASALTQTGMRVAVVEASDERREQDSCVASMFSAADFAKIAAAYGLNAARRYAAGLQAQLHALTAASLPYVREIAGYAYAFQNELPALEKQHELLLALQIPVSIAEDAGDCPFPVALSLKAGAALIDRGRWQEALESAIRRRGGRIFHNSRVIALHSGQVFTKHGQVEAPQIILTTGKPLGLRTKSLLALLESRRIVQCTLTGDISLYSSHQNLTKVGFDLFPSAEGCTVVWNAGRMGMSAQQESLRSFENTLHRLLPDWRHGEFRYAQTMHSLDGLPLIGPLPGSQILCIAGTDGSTVLGAMHAVEVMARRILGHALPEDAMYLPDRNIPKVILRPQMQRCTRIYFRSMLRQSAPVCPHCGCRMRYSIAAQCWECPYCGTCYSMLGQVLRGPGMRDAEVSVRQRPDL